MARAGLHTPPPLVQIGQGEGGGAPPFLLSLLFPPPESYSNEDWGGGILLPEGVGLLLARLSLAGRTPPLEPLYTEAGAPQRDKLIHMILFLAVCGAPCHHSPR